MIAANIYIWSPVIAAATPVIYLVRQDKGAQAKGPCKDGETDSSGQEGTRAAAAEGSRYHAKRSIAEILKGDSPELARMRDSVK